MSHRQQFLARERADLADTFATVGPDEPTLCEGWQTRDLLQHLVDRDAGPLSKMHSDTDWASLIDRFRAGPPALSPFRIPGADTAANVEEYFVHHEDVRRATAGWRARDLPAAVEESFWKRLRSPMGRLAARRAPVGVHLRRTDSAADADADHVTLRVVRPSVIVSGAPGELLLFLFGRQRAAAVELDGPADACEQLMAARLGI